MSLNPADPSHSDHLIPLGGRKAQRVWHPDSPILESVQNELVGICNRFSDEQCGVISSEWNVYPVSNVHLKPRFNFLMDELEFREIIRQIYDVREERVLGIFHTHPNNVPWPSPRDIAGWPNPRLEWRYWIATNKEVIEWELA